MKAALIAAWVALAGPALAAGPQWTWEAGKQTNNGAITLKSTNGSTTYSGTQNPTGAVAKTNQSAVTQPPTVIIQATSSGQVFNYKDDCWIFGLPAPTPLNGWTSGARFIGAGKIDTTASTFTGILGWIGGMANSNYDGGAQVMSALTGMSFSGTSTYGSGNPIWCGSNSDCAWNSSVYDGTGKGYRYYVVGAAALPVLNYQKCYP